LTWRTQISGEEATIVTVEKVAVDMVIVDMVKIGAVMGMTVEAQEETEIAISERAVAETKTQEG
jgi:hypothetical protein